MLGLGNGAGHLDRWLLLSAAGCLHRLHVDSAGMGTFVRIVKGRKMWYVATELTAGGPIEADDMEKYWDAGPKCTDTMQLFKWEVAVLGEGSML